MRPQEAVDLGHVHPAQQVRVGGGVRRAVGQLADDPLVDPADDVDRLLRVLGSRPKVVAARKVLVRWSRPHMSPRKPECSETARIAAGCSDWSSSARMPPTNIDASPCTRVIGLPGSNQRGPSRPWIRSRCRGPSGPATRANSACPELLAQVGDGSPCSRDYETGT